MDFSTLWLRWTKRRTVHAGPTYVARAALWGSALACISVALPSALEAAPKKHIAAKPAGLPPTLYDIRGIKLETTIEQFRQIPNPGFKNAKVLCTGDRAVNPSELYVDADEAALGVKKCVWWQEGSSHSYENGAMGFTLGSGSMGTIDYAFKFIKDPRDGVEKLFSFFTTANALSHDDIVNLLTAKYGKPKVTNSVVQNDLGAKFDAPESIWANPLSILTLKNRWLAIDRMAMMITDNRLYGIVAAAADAKKAQNKNPI